MKVTTKEWDILVQWNDRSKTLILFKDTRNSNPLKGTEYILSKGLNNEPVFA